MAIYFVYCGDEAKYHVSISTRLGTGGTRGLAGCQSQDLTSVAVLAVQIELVVSTVLHDATDHC